MEHRLSSRPTILKTPTYPRITLQLEQIISHRFKREVGIFQHSHSWMQTHSSTLKMILKSRLSKARAVRIVYPTHFNWTNILLMNLKELKFSITIGFKGISQRAQTIEKNIKGKRREGERATHPSLYICRRLTLELKTH